MIGQLPTAGLGVALLIVRSLLAAQRELSRRNIRLAFGNVRAAQREALRRTGSFVLIDEKESISDLRQIRAAPA